MAGNPEKCGINQVVREFGLRDWWKKCDCNVTYKNKKVLIIDSLLKLSQKLKFSLKKATKWQKLFFLKFIYFRKENNNYQSQVLDRWSIVQSQSSIWACKTSFGIYGVWNLDLGFHSFWIEFLRFCHSWKLDLGF